MLFFFLQLTVQKSPSNLTLLWKRNASFFFSFSTPCLFLLSPYSFYRLYCAPETLFFFYPYKYRCWTADRRGQCFFFTAATVYTHTHTTEEKKKRTRRRMAFTSFIVVTEAVEWLWQQALFFFFLAFVNDRIGCCFLTFTFFFCWCKQGEEWSWHPRCV